MWRTAARLRSALAGRRLLRAELRHPRWAHVDLAGHRVTEVLARGKHLLLRVVDERPGRESANLTVHSHLRMDGAWWLYREGAPWRGGPDHAVRIVMSVGMITAVGYRLHDLAVLRTSEEDTLVGHLGPDTLGPDWDTEEALRRLRRHPRRAVGVALIDQRNLAGVGTLFRAEALFLARCDPWTSVGDAGEQLTDVVERARALLLRNREQVPQNTTGLRGRDRAHWVFDRAGRPCLRCGTPVRAALMGDAGADPVYDRRVFWCPGCQGAGGG